MMVMGAGVWIILDKSGEIRDVLDIVFDPAILIVTAGCVLFVLAFFGCIGSLRENNLLLKLVSWISLKNKIIGIADNITVPTVV